MHDDMPKMMRLTMTFIDRVGFPTMAFLLMSYMCFSTLHKITDVLTENTKALTALVTEFQQHHKWTQEAVIEMRRR